MKYRFFSIVLLAAIWGCENNSDPKPVDCNQSDLSITVSSTTNPSGCDVSDGAITVSATGGASGYEYKLNNGTYVSTSTFDGLLAGTYTFTVKDESGCEKEVMASLSAPSGLTIVSAETADSGCGQTTGSITVTVSGATNPMYRIDGGTFSANNVFDGLGAGSYSVEVTDDTGCSVTSQVNVKSGIAFSIIRSIIDNSCAVSGCHNGDNSSIPNFTTDNTVASNASQIKNLTQSGAMPKTGSISDEQKAQIACWVDDGANLN